MTSLSLNHIKMLVSSYQSYIVFQMFLQNKYAILFQKWTNGNNKLHTIYTNIKNKNVNISLENTRNVSQIQSSENCIEFSQLFILLTNTLIRIVWGPPCSIKFARHITQILFFHRQHATLKLTQLLLILILDKIMYLLGLYYFCYILHSTVMTNILN